MAHKFVCSTTAPIVDTKAGKLRGFLLDNTYTFYGIKYADAARFQMPHDVAPWEGVKDALGYGYVCPMLSQDRPGSGELKVPHRYWPMDENCQYLNVWTQSIDKDAKKPVMVWLHGGGFSAGSSIEQVAYDGKNMSQYGDVVVVTINHRLNILGYLDLSPFGEKYKNSCNAGNADMVAALKWVHENIASFGGDPENVTIFGQSGGGMKVWTLMQTPEADGLFHKGIIQSGLLDGLGLGADAFGKKADGTEIVKALMKELGFDKVEQLETVPYDDLAEAYNKVAPVLAKEGKYIGGSGPLSNEFYDGDPRDVGFNAHARTIPVMIGTVLDEFMGFGPGNPNRNTMTAEEARAMIAGVYGEENADEMIALFEKAYPGKNLCDLVTLDSAFRAPTKDFIAKKSECPEAPTYSYMFAYEFPVDEGAGPWHCSEIPFVFHNTELVPVCNKPGVSDELEHRMFAAWTNFAKYGDPNDVSLPEWPACKPGDEACMIFDETCEVRHNHDNELIKKHLTCAPRFGMGHVEIQH
ncbi:MAG: carboxylesterase family protein [Candidatus Faecivivens sp.]|nr:carboxylesterase family protein [Candidatus Faecivivens sp.]